MTTTTTTTALPRMRVMRGSVVHRVEAYDNDGALYYRSLCRWRNSHRKGHKVHGPADWWTRDVGDYPDCEACWHAPASSVAPPHVM